MPITLKQKTVEEMKQGIAAPKEEEKSYKHGGHAQKHHEKINLKHCKVSTHEKNSKHKHCW